MFTLHFRIRQQLTGLLLELPGVTSALERREPDGVERLLDLLSRAERQLLDDKLRQAADLAASRAVIALARLEAPRRTQARQAERHAALHEIGAVRSALADALARSEAAIETARPAIRQLLQLVAASGALRLDSAGDASALVQRIWQLASQHEQLKPLAVQLRVALDTSDILLMLANEIDLADFAPASDPG